VENNKTNNNNGRSPFLVYEHSDIGHNYI